MNPSSVDNPALVRRFWRIDDSWPHEHQWYTAEEGTEEEVRARFAERLTESGSRPRVRMVEVLEVTMGEDAGYDDE